jgi:hypothetical protein
VLIGAGNVRNRVDRCLSGMIMLGVSRLSYKMKPALNLIGECAGKSRYELTLRIDPARNPDKPPAPYSFA